MKQIIINSVYIGIGCFLILFLLQPFGIDRIEHGRLQFCLCESLLVIVFAVIGALLSQWLFPQRKEHTIRAIILNNVPAFLINIVTLSIALSFYSLYFQYGSLAIGLPHFNIHGYALFILQVSFISFFLLVWQVYSDRNRFLKAELDEVRAINALLDARQQRLEQLEEEQQQTTPEANAPEVPEPKRCLLTGNANNATLEVCPDEIVYIESMSNYADICYLEQGEMRHKTLRITLKQLREALSDTPSLVSCHRAFMVNLNFVTSMSIRPTGGYQLNILSTDKQIPVSRSQTDMLKERLKG